MKNRIIKPLILSVLLYGCKTWRIKKKHRNNREMLYRRMFYILYIARITSEEIGGRLRSEPMQKEESPRCGKTTK